MNSKNLYKLFQTFTLLFVSFLWSQKSQLENYTFSDETIEIPSQFKDENEVVLLKNIKVDIVAENQNAIQYFLVHEKIHINSEIAVERNNRVYVPFKRDKSLIINKVRVIHENGKITELNPKDIKMETDDETGTNYHFYAVNGLTKGATIEKIFLIKENPDLDGYIVNIQDEIPIVKANFELIYPNYLVFKHKSYNGLSEATIMENAVDSEKFSLIVDQSNIEGILDDERYANWDRHIMKFKYKLEENKARGTRNLNNYLDFSKNVYDNIHKELDKKETKAIENFVKEIPKSKDQFEQIKLIENKIKSTINFNRYFNQNQSIVDLIRNKQSNAYYLLRFYAAIFKQMNIDYELVFTSKRFSNYFDKDFESMDQVNEALFYFPKLDEYMDAMSIDSRLPIVNFNYNGNYGLFVKGKEFGGATIGLGEVRKIKVPSSEFTHDVQNITIDFRNNIEKPLVHSNFQFNGYSARNFQPLKDFVPVDQYELLKKDYAQNYTVETEYTSLRFENEGLEFLGFKPLILDAKFEGTTQKAGNNILYKAGETIGRQMEMYQEHPRILPVEVYYPHKYTRTLKIILPDGYSIKNLDNFNFDKKLNVDGETVAAFTSSYVQNGNEIVVTNLEYYEILDYPLDVFEEYRAVINAAADFNKVTLVISKD